MTLTLRVAALGISLVALELPAGYAQTRSSSPSASSQAAAPARSTPASSQASASPRGPSSTHPVVQQYCVGCHNARAKVGGLALDALNLDGVAADAATWEKVVRK